MYLTTKSRERATRSSLGKGYAYVGENRVREERGCVYLHSRCVWAMHVKDGPDGGPVVWRSCQAEGGDGRDASTEATGVFQTDGWRS